MKSKTTATVLILIVLFALPALACSLSFPELQGDSQTTSEEPGESEESEEGATERKTAVTGDEIEISNTTAYLDQFGIWNIHGLLTNTADYSVGLAELEVTFPEGTPIDTYLTAPYGLAPEESMPFEIRLPDSITNVGDYELNILRLQRVNKVPVPVEIAQSNLFSAENGLITLTAEVVNNSTMDANLNSIRAALFGGDGTLITSVSCQECPRSVLAGGAVPVQFLFFGHPTDMDIDHFEIYISSDHNPGLNEIEVTLLDPVHTYQDGGGWFHVLGEIRNDSEDALNLSLVGTFFDQAGTIMGAASDSPALRSLNPGESSPYQLSFYNQGEPITDWKIQVDPAFSRILGSPTIELIPTNTQTTPSEFDWVFTGSIVNDTQTTLSSIQVVAVLRDIQSGKIVGLSQRTYLGDYPTDSTTEYSLTIRPDPGFDPGGLEGSIIVRCR